MTRNLERRNSLLTAVTDKVRLIDVELLSAFYFSDCKRPRRAALRFLQDLVEEGLLDCRKVLVRPLPLPIIGPYLTLHPGEEPPNEYQVANYSEERWSGPPKQRTVYFATKRAVNRLGGHKGGMPPAHHASHDLLVTAVYLFLANDPTTASAATDWVLEDHYQVQKFEKPGDARLVGEDGVYMQIEILGRYSPAHVRAQFAHVEKSSTPLQLF